ncbi:MAG: hypothetical protein ACRD0H_12015, partial [Actinomycetes bacterium]
MIDRRLRRGRVSYPSSGSDRRRRPPSSGSFGVWPPLPLGTFGRLAVELLAAALLLSIRRRPHGDITLRWSVN